MSQPPTDHDTAGLEHAQRMRLVSGEIPSAWLRPAESSTDRAPPRTAFATMRAAMPEPRTTFLVVLAACAAGTLAVWRLQAHVEELDRATMTPEQLVAPPTPALSRTPSPTSSSSLSTAPAVVPSPPPAAPAAAPRPVADVDVVETPVAVLLEPALPARDVADAPIGDTPARVKARDLTRRAEGLLRGGDADRAKALLEAAAGVDPTLPDVWRALGIARARQNDDEGARIAYERYLVLAPTAPDAPDVRAILGQ